MFLSYLILMTQIPYVENLFFFIKLFLAVCSNGKKSRRACSLKG